MDYEPIRDAVIADLRAAPWGFIIDAGPPAAPNWGFIDRLLYHLADAVTVDTHDLVGSRHLAEDLTLNHVLRVTSETTFDFMSLDDLYPNYRESETITGLWTFDRGADAPFAVLSGSAVVTNLNADLVDALHGSQFARSDVGDSITGNWLMVTAGEIQFRATDQRIYSSGADDLNVEAKTNILFDIAGNNKADLSATSLSLGVDLDMNNHEIKEVAKLWWNSGAEMSDDGSATGFWLTEHNSIYEEGTHLYIPAKGTRTDDDGDPTFSFHTSMSLAVDGNYFWANRAMIKYLSGYETTDNVQVHSHLRLTNGGAAAHPQFPLIQFIGSSKQIGWDGTDMVYVTNSGTHKFSGGVTWITGGLGVGTAAVPHGGIGNAKLAIDGTDANAAGPHVQFTTATNDYPLLGIYPWQHDNISQVWDGYWDGGSWKSSDPDSNFRQAKTGDQLVFQAEASIAAGNEITWVEAFHINADATLHFATNLDADWDIGSFKIIAQQFESDVTAGTPPFIVASNTVVPNLNADLLDDQEGAWYAPYHVFKDNQFPTGFELKADSTMTWNDGTLTLTLAPVTPFDIYIKGTKYTFSTNQTAVITDTEGVWYFFFNASGVLTASQSIWDFRANAPVSLLYWDETAKVALDHAEERHSANRNNLWHIRDHYTQGTLWRSGLSAGDYTTAGDGSADADAQLSIADGEIHDEDLLITITDGSPQDLAPIANIPVYYLNGATPDWRKTVVDAFPVYDNVGDEISYNLDTAGTWSHPAATNNYFVAMWIFATTNVGEPVVAVLGQRQDSKLDAAQDNNTYDTLVWNALPFQEWKIIYRLIFHTRSPQHTNTPHCRLVDILDFRSVANIPAGTYVATAHNSLTSRDARNAHPASAIRVDLTNMDHLLSGLVADITDDVQAAFEVLDDILENAQTVNADWMWGTTKAIQYGAATEHIHGPGGNILELDAASYVRVGEGTTGHGLGTDDFLVSGELEVNASAWFDGLATFYGTTKFRDNVLLTFGNASDAQMKWGTANTRHALVVGVGNTSNTMILTRVASIGQNFDHDNQAHPTFYGQDNRSPAISNNAWYSIVHDATGMLISTGPNVGAGTVPATIDNYIMFAPRGVEAGRFEGDGNYLVTGTNEWRFGVSTEHIHGPGGNILELDAASYVRVGEGTTSHGLGTDALFVTGKLEVDSHAHFDSTVYLWGNVNFYGYLNTGSNFILLPQITYDELDFGLGAGVGRQLILTDYTNTNYDHDHPVQANVTLYGHDARRPTVSNNAWYSIVHDATGMLISTGANVGAGTVPATIENDIRFAPRGVESMWLSGVGKLGVGAAPLTNECDVGCLKDGVLALKETTTPTTDATYGKFYTKADNLLYFQSGDGVEHTVAYV